MGSHLLAVAVTLLCSAVTSARASLIVSSFRVAAGTNAFAPLDQSLYFDQQIMENTSPAIATATGDWTGTNFGGSSETWHWIGSSSIDTVTLVNSTVLTISGNTSFSREITTTADFVSPNLSTTLYSPLSSAGYTCFFGVDAPATYKLAGQLRRDSQFQLYSISQGVLLVDKFNVGTVPIAADFNGVLASGQYQLIASAGTAGLSFNQGAHHELGTGGFTNFLFTVQVPEPAGGAGIELAAGLLVPRRRVGRK